MTLIKVVVNLFYKVVCHHYAKENTMKAVFPHLGLRQKFIKLVLLKNV